MAAPITYELHMRELDEQLSEPDLENVENPLTKFIESRAAAFAGASAGISAFQKINKTPFKPPVDDTGGNPWLVKHETVHSQQIEADWDEEIPGDPRELAKRFGQDSGRAALTEWIRRCIDGGDTVEALAEFAEQNDPARAELIREIGKTL